MRIAIDHLPAVTHPPGIGRYARELVRALVALEDGPALVRLELGRAVRLYTESELGLDGRAAVVARNWPRAAQMLLARFGRAADELAGAPDVVHQVRLPPLPVRAALQSIALAQLPAPGSIPERALRTLLARAALAFVFSSAAEEDLRDRYGLPSDRVARVPVGADHWRREVDALRPPDRPARVLVLGRLLDEREPLAAVHAHRLLRARGLDVELRFVAPRPTRPESRGPLANELGARVHGYDDDLSIVWDGREDARAHERRLPELVARSSVLLHLDRAPATPVTPLEALALGVPVVASRRSVFVEAFGAEPERARGALALLDHDPGAVDVDLLADALAVAIERRSDDAARADLELRARPFTWAASARAHVEAWRAFLSSR